MWIFGLQQQLLDEVRIQNMYSKCSNVFNQTKLYGGVRVRRRVCGGGRVSVALSLLLCINACSSSACLRACVCVCAANKNAETERKLIMSIWWQQTPATHRQKRAKLGNTHARMHTTRTGAQQHHLFKCFKFLFIKYFHFSLLLDCALIIACMHVSVCVPFVFRFASHPIRAGIEFFYFLRFLHTLSFPTLTPCIYYSRARV